jgi:PAS domain S-box-containing protein
MSSGPAGSRHRLLLIVLWAHVPLLAALGLFEGESILSVALTSMLLIVFSVAGMLIRSVVGASIAVAVGLVTSSVVLAAYSPEASLGILHALVMIAAVSIYRMWQPLLAAVVAVSSYLFLDAAIEPGEGTMVTAAVRSGLAVMMGLILASGWRGGDAIESVAGTLSRLRLAFEAAPLGMAILKPSGEILQVNQAMGVLLGYEPDELVGRNVRSIVHTDDMAEVGDAWEQMGNAATHSAISWLRCMTSSGSMIWGRISLSLVLRTGEHPAMVVLQIEDVTSSYQDQRRLEDLLDGKDEFVTAVAEEIRDPLEGLIELATAAEAGARAGDEARVEARVGQMRGQIHWIASIIDDLVVSARADTRARPAAALPVDAGTMCHDVVAAIAGAERVTVEIEAREVWADPTLARQILTALVGNAVRYGGPHVRVRAITSGPDTVIEVIDDGVEIPATERERVFNSDLSRGRPLTKPATVGLGLTVGRRLARQMDGDLTYRRTATGDNIFELRLPSEQFVTDSSVRDADIPA